MTRPYEPADREAFLALAKQDRWTRITADPDHPLNFCTRVFERDGQMAGAMLVRATVEPILYVNEGIGTRQERWEMCQRLGWETANDPRLAGIHEAHLFIAPDNMKWAKKCAPLPYIYLDPRIHMILDLNEMRAKEAK